MNEVSRRKFFKNATALSLSTLPLATLAEIKKPDPSSKLKVFCVGGHPDDPESGCGGTLSKLSAAGHDVNVLYLTRGEAGIEGKSHIEASAIRTKEAEEACKIMKVKPFFLGQVDGSTSFDTAWINKMVAFMEAEKPDIVFSHWPIDTHKDHQVASLLTIQAWMAVKKKFQLYCYEVCIGNQTTSFHPTDYVDISETQETKKRAINCHVSQHPESIYSCGHEIMEKFRGAEAGFKAAEAFTRLNGKSAIATI